MNPSFNLFPTPEHEPLSEFSADTSYYWGIGRDSGLAVRLFVPGNLGPEPTVGYTEPAGVCGLLNGRIDCFDSIPDSRDESLTLLDGWRLYAGLTVDNVLIGITNTGSDPQDIPLTRPVVEIMTFEPSTRCVLYEEGDVECFGPLEVTFPDPPYVDISGGGWHGCASKETGVLDCSGGRQVDFGEPLRDFVVTQDDIFEKAPGWDEGDERYIGRLPTVEDDPFICAITESNAIRCTGWRYEFSDLQNALPRGYYGAWR